MPQGRSEDEHAHTYASLWLRIVASVSVVESMHLKKISDPQYLDELRGSRIVIRNSARRREFFVLLHGEQIHPNGGQMGDVRIDSDPPPPTLRNNVDLDARRLLRTASWKMNWLVSFEEGSPYRDDR